MWLLDTSLPFNRFLLTQLNERLGQFIGMVEFDRLLEVDARVARCLAAMFNPLSIRHQAVVQLSQEEIGTSPGVAPAREPGAAAARAGGAGAHRLRPHHGPAISRACAATKTERRRINDVCHRVPRRRHSRRHRRASWRGDVRVEGSRITAVHHTAMRSSTEDAVAVECGGRTLMPGLIESHAHLSFVDRPRCSSTRCFLSKSTCSRR